MFHIICIRRVMALAIISHLKVLNQSTCRDVIPYTRYNFVNVTWGSSGFRGVPNPTGGVKSFRWTPQPSTAWVGQSAQALGAILDFSSLSLCFIFSLRFKKLHDYWVIFLIQIFPHCPFFHFLAFHTRMINELTNELTQYFQMTDAFCIYIPFFCRGLLFLFYLFVERIFVWFHFTFFCGLEREAKFQLD